MKSMLLFDNLSLKPSRFSFVFRRDNKIALYHSLNLQIAYLNNEGYLLFKRCSGDVPVSSVLSSLGSKYSDGREILMNLYNCGLLVRSDDLEDRYERHLRRTGVVDIRMMYVICTDVCNLRCEYCFLENAFPSNYRFSHLSESTLQKGLRIFFETSSASAEENRRIIFYGGEPLLNKHILEAGFSLIRSHSNASDVEIHLITNGTLLTPSFAKILKDNRVKVSISLDGTETVHDAARRTSEGEKTFSSAYRGYRLLKEAGIEDIGLSVTVGAHNVNNLPLDIESLVDELGVRGLGFNFLIDLPGERNPLAVDSHLATQKMIQAFELLRDRGIYEDRIMRKLIPFVKSKIHLKDCGGLGNQIVLAPDGLIGPCHGFLHSREYFNHHVDEGSIDFQNDPVYREWANNIPVNNSVCYECAAIAVCGGGCRYQAKLATGSLAGMDERMCEHNRVFLEWAIWDAFSQKSKSDDHSRGAGKQLWN